MKECEDVGGAQLGTVLDLLSVEETQVSDPPVQRYLHTFENSWAAQREPGNR